MTREIADILIRQTVESDYETERKNKLIERIERLVTKSDHATLNTKEVALICGVTEKTIRENAKTFGKAFENGKPTEWTEDEVKKVQLILMNNIQNRGNASTKEGVVEEQAVHACTGYLSLQAIAESGNVEAMKEYMQQMVAYTETKHELKLQQEQNKLLLEQKDAAEAETERIRQYNKNFHNSLYTATDIAEMLCVTSNKVGREARKHNLKQEPLYGKLGKVQLNNGKWVDQFYYNDDAVRILKAICNTEGEI